MITELNIADYVPEYQALGSDNWEKYHRPDFDGAAMTLEEAQFLAALLAVKKPRIALELGCSRGFSTTFLAQAAEESGTRLIAVDHDQSMCDEAGRRVASAGFRVEVYCASAIAYVSNVDLTFEFALIDTDLQTREEELWALWPRLEDGAVVAIHDANPLHPLRDSSNLLRALRMELEYGTMQLMYVPSPRGLAIVVKGGISG